MAVALVALAAWLPSLRPYVAAAEDFSRVHVPDPSLAAYWNWALAQYRVEGLWRLVGFPFTDISRHVHPLGFPLFALASHAVNGLLLAHLLRRLKVGEFLSTWAALCFVALPCAVEANMYSVASQSIQATTAFLLIASGLVGALRCASVSVWSLGLCFLAVLMGNAIQENLMFAYTVLPASLAFVLWPRTEWSQETARAVAAYTMCTLLAIGTFVVVTMGARTDPTKAPSLHLGTILSFPVHQTTNLIPYQVWSHADLLGLVFRHESIATLVVSVVLLVAGLTLAMPTLVERSVEADESADSRARRLLGAALALWYAAGFIYVLGGGYSFESRKKYVTLAFLAIVGAVVASRGVQAVSGRQARRGALGLAIGAIVLSAATTWVVSGLWVLEARRGSALVSAIAARPDVTAVAVRFVPDLISLWPQWRDVASSQHHAAWVTELEVFRRFGRTVHRVPAGQSSATELECRYGEGFAATCNVRPSD